MIAPLHTHTTYSVLDGASTIDEYMKWCKDNGAPGMAVTDHGWMIGALEVYEKGKKNNITGIPGCEFYVAPDKNYKFAGKAYDYYHVTVWAINEKGYRNLIKLGSIAFRDDEIETQKYTKDSGNFLGPHKRVVKKFGDVKPRITFDELLTYHEGLVLGSGCLIGSLSKALLSGEKEGAEFNLNRLLDVYKDRLFMEVMPHNCTHNYDRNTKSFIHNECTDFAPDGDIQKAVNTGIIDLAKKYNLPLIMSIDSHFVKPSQKAIQDAILQQGDPTGWTFYESYHMQTTGEAWENWQKLHGSDINQQKIFTEAVENTHRVVDMAKDLKIKNQYQMPNAEVPERILVNSTSKDESLKILLFEKIEEHGRMKWDNQTWVDRLQYELSVVCDNGVQNFAEYFLFEERWMKWAREMSVLTGVGRGSAAGCLLTYLLKITHLDPVDEWKLPFERFLSTGRIKRMKWPDIDSDFAFRDIVMAKIFEYYGDRAAQCSTHGKIKIKSAVKDVHRFLVIRKLERDLDNTADFHEKENIRNLMQQERIEVEKVTKCIENTPTGVDDHDFLMGYTDKEGNFHKGHLEQNPTLQEYFKKHSSEDSAHDMQHLVESLLGIPRSVGRHASALLVSDRPIEESVPTCDVSGVLCTQYTANGDNFVEKAGLIKFDLLTVNTLQDISNCIRLIQKSRGYKTWIENVTINNKEFRVIKGELTIEDIPSPFDDSLLNIYKLPERDEVFDMLCRGDTSSCFQVSTPLMTQWTMIMKPRKKKDLSALVALVRPGPLDSLIEDGKTTMAMAYVKRKNGEMNTTYIHPKMEDILKDDHGVLLYQEGMAACFQELAGYTAEEADYIRELVGKKKKQDMEKIIPELRTKLTSNGWTPEQTQTFIDACIAAARYSFNKAHSASYGVTAYMSAFLKCFYPVEWWTAVLQNCKVEEIRTKGYAKAISHILLNPHVNGPTDSFDARKDGKVHSPLWLIDGVGDAACKAIETARGSVDFISLQDFFERIDKRAVNEGVMKKLILVGAFDLIEPNRRPEDLYEEYIYLKTVLGQKSHANKTGDDLKKAVMDYKNKKVNNTKLNEAILSMTFNDIELQNEKMKLLPIHKFDVHEGMKQKLSKLVAYDRPDPDDEAVFGSLSYGEIIDIVKGSVVKRKKEVIITNNQAGLDMISDLHKNKEGYMYAGWAGIVSGVSEFQYTDKETKMPVSALKLQIVNCGDTLECVLWPTMRKKMKNEEIKEPSEGSVVVCAGNMKPAKNPGTWQISADFVREIS